jgi:hypothetical protein
VVDQSVAIEHGVHGADGRSPDVPDWSQWLALLSPLSYAVDLIRIGFGEPGYWSPLIDAIALAGFTVSFLVVAYRFHLSTRDRAR